MEEAFRLLVRIPAELTMHRQSTLVDLHEGVRRERVRNCGKIGSKKCQQIIIRNVPRRHKQQPLRETAQKKRIDKIRVLCHQHALFTPRKLAQRLVRRLVFRRQIERVQRVVAEGFEQSRNTAGQLRIHEELHGASATRFASLNRAA